VASNLYQRANQRANELIGRLPRWLRRTLGGVGVAAVVIYVGYFQELCLRASAARRRKC
jgi:hypothetical protein